MSHGHRDPATSTVNIRITTTAAGRQATDDETPGHCPGPSLELCLMVAGAGIPFLSTAATRYFFLLHRPFFGADARGGCRRHCASLLLNGQASVQYRGHDCDGGLMFGLLFLWLMG